MTKTNHLPTENKTQYSHLRAENMTEYSHLPPKNMTQYSHHYTTMRSDKTIQVLTDTSLQLVMPIKSNFFTGDSTESYIYDYT